MDLEGKCALITGGARGIGRGMALALARGGVNVLVSDIGGHAKNTPGYELSKTEQLEATTKEIAGIALNIAGGAEMI